MTTIHECECGVEHILFKSKPDLQSVKSLHAALRRPKDTLFCGGTKCHFDDDGMGGGGVKQHTIHSLAYFARATRHNSVLAFKVTHSK